MSLWAWLDRADAWVETPEVQMLKGLFLVSLLGGAVLAWLWNQFNSGGRA